MTCPTTQRTNILEKTELTIPLTLNKGSVNPKGDDAIEVKSGSLAMPPTKKLIAYFRVSTAKQGQSRLGLESQQATVNRHAKQLDGRVLVEYCEVESGKRKDRPELLKAVAHAKRTKATLVVAKLDRLSRNAAFLFTLRDSGLPLLFCDMPHANELTVGIMAVVAEEERKMIGTRTEDALEHARSRLPSRIRRRSSS